MIDKQIESVYGRKAALCLVSVEWKHKESALKHVIKSSEKQLSKPDSAGLEALIEASVAVVGLTCQEKVIKVLNLSLQLFSNTISAQKVEQESSLAQALKQAIIERQIVAKLL